MQLERLNNEFSIKIYFHWNLNVLRNNFRVELSPLAELLRCMVVRALYNLIWLDESIKATFSAVEAWQG
jgi:hypothetical protein